ncbi:MAG TPA: carbonic anhydrase [Methylophilaceae bacterium]|nr:carbonic anhydrase [Methylophilaceae bacterium]HQR61168.1 carbonic anhydrase [Methylophilaceae bacterium]
MRDVSKFLSGFRRFQHHYLGARRAYFDRLIKEGQHPTALVVACCDSRCDPALLTDCDPGDMFVVRNVANLVPPYTQAGSFAATSSAIAFAVHQLEVEHVIVMGHAQCGGIRTLIEHKPVACDEDQLIAKWLGIAEDARQKAMQALPGRTSETQARACEQASILVSLENLMSYPWIKSRVEAGKLLLLGWYFDMVNGELLQYEADPGEFRALVSHEGIGKSTEHLWWRAPG